MDSESSYTDDEITEVAENVAEFLLNTFNTKPIGRGVLLISKQYQEGPLATFLFWSNRYNPFGEFRIEAETLTMAQKGIVVRIVGNAMAKLGSDRQS